MNPDDENPIEEIAYERPLSPCPFCASEDLAVKTQKMFADGDPDLRSAYWVECMGCATTGPLDFSVATAASRWNTRWFT